MIHFRFLTTILLSLASLIEITWGADENRDYFVFLTTGKSTQGVVTEEVQKKQQAHLENFGRLAKLGSLTAAGPCADPGKTIRGIVVVNADSIPDAESKFGPDPYVSEGFMKSELHQYETIAGKLQLVLEVTSMEESIIVVLNRGSKWSKEQSSPFKSSWTAFAKEQHASKALGFAALFTDQSNNESKRLGVMIFRGKDMAAVKSILESHELVRNEIVGFQAFPQYLAKGAIAD